MTVMLHRLDTLARPDHGWRAVCAWGDLIPERGAAALVDGEQVAVFRLHDASVAAVGNRDPFSGAHVMSRGIVGNRGEVQTVASPMFKQVFDLRDVAASTTPRFRSSARDARVHGGLVLLRRRS